MIGKALLPELGCVARRTSPSGEALKSTRSKGSYVIDRSRSSSRSARPLSARSSNWDLELQDVVVVAETVRGARLRMGEADCGGYGEGRKAVGKRRDVKSWTMRRQPENSRGEVKGQCWGLLF